MYTYRKKIKKYTTLLIRSKSESDIKIIDRVNKNAAGYENAKKLAIAVSFSLQQ